MGGVFGYFKGEIMLETRSVNSRIIKTTDIHVRRAHRRLVKAAKFQMIFAGNWMKRYYYDMNMSLSSKSSDIPRPQQVYTLNNTFIKEAPDDISLPIKIT